MFFEKSQNLIERSFRNTKQLLLTPPEWGERALSIWKNRGKSWFFTSSSLRPRSALSWSDQFFSQKWPLWWHFKKLVSHGYREYGDEQQQNQKFMVIGLHKNCIRDHSIARTCREMDCTFFVTIYEWNCTHLLLGARNVDFEKKILFHNLSHFMDRISESISL